jgi:hypothetical protein
MTLEASLRQARRFLALSQDERCLLASAFAWLLLVDVGLRLRNFRFVVSHARPLTRPGTGTVTDVQAARAREFARWIDVAARHHFVSARCLHCALVLHLWLRDQHLASQLRIGVRTVEGQLEAHAWVDLDGQIVDISPDWVALFAPLTAANGQLPDWSGAARWSLAKTSRGARSVEAA